MFRVLVRGKFDGLDEAQKASLRGSGGPMFSAEGSFTFDSNVTAFTFRCQVPAGPDDDERVARERATEALRAHGLPYRDLAFSVTDMRDIRVRRKR
ncbi:hypothetical protein EWH70_30875 [Amycolatopsis suaedae]|uniref:Uncharacterized protein n=1 Tax=Amycolatopsis suaedae TaxID=2510978 RepID=A0A4Q7IYU6_9PSEU|nr:hypothetical protein EWH70_30875 [Amycolatopsis suaedae]